MEFLKWLVSTLLALAILGVLLASGALLGLLGASLGAICLGGFILFLVTAGIREHFGNNKGEDT